MHSEHIISEYLDNCNRFHEKTEFSGVANPALLWGTLQYRLWNPAEPFAAEIGVAVVSIEVANRQYGPLQKIVVRAIQDLEVFVQEFEPVFLYLMEQKSNKEQKQNSYSSIFKCTIPRILPEYHCAS